MAQQPLFGYSPEQIMQARQAAMQERAAAEASRVGGGWAPLYEQSRRLSMMGADALGRGLFPQAQDPALQRAQVTQSIVQKYRGQDFNSPSVLSQMASEFSEAGIPELAMELGDMARKLTPKAVKRDIKEVGGSLIDVSGETPQVIYTAPEKQEKESIVKTGETTAKAASELGFGVRPNLNDYSQAEMAAINNLLQTRGEKIQAAGVPQPGQVKPTDLNTATQIVDRFTKASKEKLDTVRDARTQLNLAKKGEGAAFAQLQRQLIKLVGDSQISSVEVRSALGSAGIVGDTISAVNQFMTGVPSASKLDSVEKVINALERVNAQSYNQGRTRSQTVLKEGAFSEQTVNALVPPEYVLRTPGKQNQAQGSRQTPTGRGPKQEGAKAPQFQQGKVYRDANGNRARYVDGKWVPL